MLNQGHTAEYKRPGQYVFWAEEEGIYVDDDFPITNLQRFFSIENLKLLGFAVKADNLVLDMPKDKVKAMAARIIADFQAGKNVSSVFQPDQAKAYIEQVRQACGVAESEPASKGKSQSDGEDSSSDPPDRNADDENDRDDELGGQGKSPGDRSRPTPLTHPGDRQRIFGRQSPRLNVPESEIKARTVVAELRAMDLKKTPFAATMLLRALIELSDAHYRKRFRLKNAQSLAKNVKASAAHMLGRQALTADEEDMVKRLCNTDAKLLNIDTLQKMLHRATHNSNREFVNNFWDNIGCFVRACWN